MFNNNGLHKTTTIILVLAFSYFATFCCFCTNAKVKKNKTAEQKPHAIGHLPGIQFKVNFEHYSGYLEVAPSRHLFYWFVGSQHDAAKDPLIFWFNGGPGSSSLYGLLTELGPYLVNEDGKTLRRNPHAWNRNASVVFLEAPAGVGFSYNTSQYDWSDDNTSADNYAAVKQFFKLFPTYRDHRVFITGESYAGVYVPTLVERILDGMAEFPIKLEGMAIGNGQFNDTLDVITQMQWAYYHGFIDELGFSNLQRDCNYNIDNCDRRIVHDFYMHNSATPWWQLDEYDMYQACVDEVQQLDQNGTSRTVLKCENAYYDDAVEVYLNQKEVRQALRVAPEVMARNWTIDNDIIFDAYNRTYVVGDNDLILEKNVSRGMEEVVRGIVDSGLRVLLYYGDTDIVCNFLHGQKFAANLGYNQTAEGNQPWAYLDVNGGIYTKYKGGQLTFTTIRGAGHMVPRNRAPQALQAINAFMNNQTLGPINLPS